MTSAVIWVWLKLFKKERCLGKYQPLHLRTSLALPFSGGLYIPMFGPRNCFNRMFCCSLQERHQDAQCNGLRCIREQRCALFSRFGDGCQWHSANAALPLCEGFPQRTLAHGLRCQPVISLWHWVDSSERFVTWWFSWVRVLLQRTGFTVKDAASLSRELCSVGLGNPTGWTPPPPHIHTLVWAAHLGLLPQL